MNQWIIMGGLVTALALAALFVGLYAIYCAHRLAYRTRAAVEAAREECAAAVEAMQAELERMAAQLRETPRLAAVEPLPGAIKSCMNLTKRSQALRLRRQGDSSKKIAESLEITRQEVDLLFKVHEIVLNNL